MLQPHRDALILTLGVGDYDVRRILVDPGSSADLLQVAVIKQMGFIPSSLENPGRTLSRFNGSSTISLGDVTLGHFGTRAKNQVALAPIQMVATPKCCKKGRRLVAQMVPGGQRPGVRALSPPDYYLKSAILHL